MDLAATSQWERLAVDSWIYNEFNSIKFDIYRSYAYLEKSPNSL